MSNVRVWNDNIYEHREMFRGDEIVIPSGGYIEMAREDAVLFKSQFRPLIRNKGGVDDPRGFKKIRIEYNPDTKAVKDIIQEHRENHTCQACGFVAQSKAGLQSHIRANHAAQMIDNDAREALENEA